MTWRLHPAEIVGGATAFNQSLGEFLARLQRYRELGAPVPMPDEATMESLYGIFPDEYDEDMLTAFDEEEGPVYLSTVDPRLLVRIAGRHNPIFERHTPAALHTRFGRLGLWILQDIFSTSRSGKAQALRFTHTEIFDRPPAGNEMKKIFTKGGFSGSLRGPSSISAELFTTVYTGDAHGSGAT